MHLEAHSERWLTETQSLPFLTHSPLLHRLTPAILEGVLHFFCDSSSMLELNSRKGSIGIPSFLLWILGLLGLYQQCGMIFPDFKKLGRLCTYRCPTIVLVPVKALTASVWLTPCSRCSKNAVLLIRKKKPHNKANVTFHNNALGMQFWRPGFLVRHLFCRVILVTMQSNFLKSKGYRALFWAQSWQG